MDLMLDVLHMAWSVRISNEKERRVNFHYLLRRLLGKPTCILGEDARLDMSARVVNIGGDSRKIRIGANSVVKGELLVFPHGGSIEIGDWCYVGEGARIWSGARVLIGSRVLISHNVNVVDNQTHPIDASARHEHFRRICTTGHPPDINLGDIPVTIEDDVWIAANAIVMRGVTVHRGAIVGTGAVVTDDVPPYSIVAGNPARVVRKIEVSGGS